MGVFSKKDSKGYRVFLTMEDYSIFLFKESNIVWSREESLSNINQLAFVDLPIESIFLKSDLELGIFLFLFLFNICLNFISLS